MRALIFALLVVVSSSHAEKRPGEDRFEENQRVRREHFERIDAENRERRQRDTEEAQERMAKLDAEKWATARKNRSLEGEWSLVCSIHGEETKFSFHLIPSPTKETLPNGSEAALYLLGDPKSFSRVESFEDVYGVLKDDEGNLFWAQRDTEELRPFGKEDGIDIFRLAVPKVEERTIPAVEKTEENGYWEGELVGKWEVEERQEGRKRFNESEQVRREKTEKLNAQIESLKKDIKDNPFPFWKWVFSGDARESHLSHLRYSLNRRKWEDPIKGLEDQRRYLGK